MSAEVGKVCVSSADIETARLANERVARIRQNPYLRYVGFRWCDLEFEQQAECYGYVREQLLAWEGEGRDRTMVLGQFAIAQEPRHV